ncbi:hypothetical protein [Halobaculum litoreum]|uniref:Uncharacterized protein n=1 Tax=Halobaculum litoreum TaxID=3031998 RepID=A0ABD5XTG0_9EURY|nr:hypothetical protein [Halobaculum sp. DT92]
MQVLQTPPPEPDALALAILVVGHAVACVVAAAVAEGAAGRWLRATRVAVGERRSRSRSPPWRSSRTRSGCSARSSP